MMKKVVGFFVSLMMGSFAFAGTINEFVMQSFQASMLSNDVQTQGLKLVVGDEAHYSLNMSIIKGSMSLTVKEVSADQAVIAQDMDMGFAGKQNCEVTLNPNTGETKSIVCNGKEQDRGEPSDLEIIETKEDTVKVPAGTFTCLYVKAKQKSNNQVVEQWANLRDVPVFGMVKTVAPSQLGKVTIELKSFKKN